MSLKSRTGFSLFIATYKGVRGEQAEAGSTCIMPPNFCLSAYNQKNNSKVFREN